MRTHDYIYKWTYSSKETKEKTRKPKSTKKVENLINQSEILKDKQECLMLDILQL